MDYLIVYIRVDTHMCVLFPTASVLVILSLGVATCWSVSTERKSNKLNDTAGA